MAKHLSNHFTIETGQEEDGRWIAEILEISGVLVYGNNQQQAIAHVQALALRVIADKLEHGEMALGLTSFKFVAAQVFIVMSQWSSAKARKVLAALEKIGWNVKRQSWIAQDFRKTGLG